MQSETGIKQQHDDFATVVQITDTHIQADPADDFDGVNTRYSLAAILRHIEKKAGECDAILVTGDLVHDPVPESYTALAELLAKIPVPVFCIPGNHDDPVLMETHLNTGNISTTKCLLFDQWQICMLDSWLPGTHAGQLKPEELQYLENKLNEHADKYALVVLHHPPVTIGSPWMDRMGLKNPDDLFSVVDQHNQVRAMAWGHIHQEFDSVRKHVRLLATPSTCVQFTPHADEYSRDRKLPGYRILELQGQGVLQTTVTRVPID